MEGHTYNLVAGVRNLRDPITERRPSIKVPRNEYDLEASTNACLNILLQSSSYEGSLKLLPIPTVTYHYFNRPQKYLIPSTEV